MQGIRAATLPVARRGLTLLALTGGTSLSSFTSKTLCEKKTEVFTKDAAGNINWSKTIARIPEPAFWDDVAKAAGENVSQKWPGTTYGMAGTKHIVLTVSSLSATAPRRN